MNASANVSLSSHSDSDSSGSEYLDYKVGSPETSMLSVINHFERLIGLQKQITLCAETRKDLVRALRYHPRYEHMPMKELLALVRKGTKNELSMSVKLSEKLVPLFSSVLQAERIGVRVSDGVVACQAH